MIEARDTAAADGSAKGAKVLSDEERTVDISQIPLPPQELIDELDNSGLVDGGSEGTSKAAQASSKPVAVLDYVDGEPETTVALVFPFRLDGREVRQVQVRPLTVQETGAIVQAKSDADTFEYYAAMTGLPAPVIRALRGQDGDAVTEACYPFLPRFMKRVG